MLQACEASAEVLESKVSTALADSLRCGIAMRNEAETSRLLQELLREMRRLRQQMNELERAAGREAGEIHRRKCSPNLDHLRSWQFQCRTGSTAGTTFISVPIGF